MEKRFHSVFVSEKQLGISRRYIRSERKDWSFFCVFIQKIFLRETIILILKSGLMNVIQALHLLRMKSSITQAMYSG